MYNKPMNNKHNCILCGSITNKPFCHLCIDEARTYYDCICDFIENNPKPTVINVYSETAIPFVIIKAFVDMGWLALVDQKLQRVNL